MTSNVTGAGRQLRGRLSLLLAVTAAAWLGAGCTQDETLDPAFVDTDSPSIGGIAQACTPGDTRDCYVTLGQQGDVLICYTGTQTCGELGWGECSDGAVSEVPAPTTTALGPAGTRTQAYSTDTGCEENPCDPFCRTFVEVPPLPLEADTDPNDWRFTWPVGSAADLPDGLYEKGFQEPCEGGWDCQFNSRCLAPNDGSCSHTLCQTGAALADECTSCVAAICDVDPTCCGAAEAPPCETGEVLGPDLTTCYWFERTSASWTTARTNCQARGAGWDLATVKSSVVQSFVHSYMVADNWIGLNDRAVEGNWSWPDGSVHTPGVDYGNWNTNEPNQAGDEDCTEVYIGDGRWNDLNCNNYQDYVCAGPRLNASSCTHDPCLQGAALKSGCNGCVAQICGTAGLEYCCDSAAGAWDEDCAQAVLDVCGNTCDCGAGEVFWGGSCYFHSGNVKEPGYYAYINCLARGSGWNLASIGSQEEQDQIFSLWDTVWIGFTDAPPASTDTNWVWLNGDPAGVWNESTGGPLYTHWATGEPRSNEDCTILNADGDWESAPCNSSVKENWLCEGPGARMTVMSGGTAVGATGSWDQSCVDMVFTECDGQCDPNNPDSTVGQCLPWYAGEVDPTCAGVDLALDIPCDLEDGTPVLPVCNHGNTEAPAGIRIVHFAANSQQYPLCSPDQSHPSIEECFTSEAIPPGYCTTVTDCPMPGNNREIMINPAWPGSVEECSCVDNWGLYNSQDCGPPTCSAGVASTTPLYDPVDVIFVIDNSGSMAGEIAAVQDRITSDFSSIIEGSGLDYRVIMIARYGEVNTAVGDSNHPICIASPLGAGTCADPASDALYLNPPRFFHYSANIESNDAWCKLLGGFSRPDELDGDGRWGWTSLAPNGWGTWLREEAFKTFVVITDDNAVCSDYGYSFNDGDLGATNVTMGQTAAAQFDTALLTLSPAQFGTAAERNYIWHSIVGLSEYGTPSEAWPASDPIQTGQCAPGSESPGTGYQALSILTGGLRFPSCRIGDFNAIFQDIADGVISNAELSCSWEINSTVPIEPSSTTATWVWGGGDEVELTRVRGPEECAPNSWYYITPTDPRTITLCPETCEDIHADTGAAVIVDIGCAVPAIETVFTERYEAVCSIEGAPQWSNLYWNAAIPDDGSRIQFRVRTAPTLDELDNATFVDVATATTSNQVCEDTCFADVFTPLAMPNNRYPFLELEITILPGTEADSPLLDTWELTFSCQPDE